MKYITNEAIASTPTTAHTTDTIIVVSDDQSLSEEDKDDADWLLEGAIDGMFVAFMVGVIDGTFVSLMVGAIDGSLEARQ